eukprot:3528609-Prorocentrum_lima.AAC.1
MVGPGAPWPPSSTAPPATSHASLPRASSRGLMGALQKSPRKPRPPNLHGGMRRSARTRTSK